MENEWVPLVQIAEELKRDPGSVRDSLKRRGVDLVLMPSRSRLGPRQQWHCSRADYERLRSELERGVVGDDAPLQSRGAGVFYLVQLEPEHLPGRVKVGFTGNIVDRLSTYRTGNPYAVVVRTWPCRPTWEVCAIESVTRDCEKLGPEVFEGDLDRIQALADAFFAACLPLEGDE